MKIVRYINGAVSWMDKVISCIQYTLFRLIALYRVEFRSVQFLTASLRFAQPFSANSRRIHDIRAPTRPIVTVYMNIAPILWFTIPRTVSLLCTPG